MRKMVSAWVKLLVCAVVYVAPSGCGDDVRTVKTIKTQEQEPVRMVSPGSEIVE